ncbi:MAG: hypothetical protein DMG21_12900 [Acidobacteria bacterium]|nr:MAG: hypothetical protein DMG21_12900 [Acidobacteriota bacterium]
MSEARRTLTIYTVVDVMSGVGVGTKSFCVLKLAQAYLKRLRKKRNPDKDDVQLFEDTVLLPKRQRRAA